MDSKLTLYRLLHTYQTFVPSVQRFHPQASSGDPSANRAITRSVSLPYHVGTRLSTYRVCVEIGRGISADIDRFTLSLRVYKFFLETGPIMAI